jgi:hypothetical protein
MAYHFKSLQAVCIDLLKQLYFIKPDLDEVTATILLLKLCISDEHCDGTVRIVLISCAGFLQLVEVSKRNFVTHFLKHPKGGVNFTIFSERVLNFIPFLRKLN